MFRPRISVTATPEENLVLHMRRMHHNSIGARYGIDDVTVEMQCVKSKNGGLKPRNTHSLVVMDGQKQGEKHAHSWPSRFVANEFNTENVNG